MAAPLHVITIGYLEEFYEQSSVQDADLDFVYDLMEPMLKVNPASIDKVFAGVECSRLPIDLVMALLTAAAPRKSELTQYAQFYSKLLLRLAFLEGPETAAETLRGLEP